MSGRVVGSKQYLPVIPRQYDVDKNFEILIENNKNMNKKITQLEKKIETLEASIKDLIYLVDVDRINKKSNI